MYISKVELKHIRCFENFSVELKRGDELILWTMILGDNATGKTTLLRSIAIGLCDESSAAGLLKESEEGYIRRDKNDASILIELRDEIDPEEIYSIVTTIELIKSQGDWYFERLRQTTSPPDEFPWDKIFVCAYGADRGTSGSADMARYTAISAVYNIFNNIEGLQNPELAIRRIEREDVKKEILLTLNRIMETDNISIPLSGIEIDGPWGPKMPLRDLADGYKSTFLWVTDLFGRALSYNPEIEYSREISGIVLIDEIEQHLHPKWQRHVIHRLKKEFPKIQFLTTSHSPLIARSVGQLTAETDREQLLYLELQKENVIKLHKLETLKGLNIDQILASKAFDYIIGADPEVEKLLEEASELAGKGNKRDVDENKRYLEFKKVLKKILQPDGQTLAVRDVQKDLYLEMKKQIKELEMALFGENS